MQLLIFCCNLFKISFIKRGGGGGGGGINHTRKCTKVENSDGHISTTKKDNKILWLNSLPLLS